MKVLSYVVIVIVIILQSCTGRNDYTVGSGIDYRSVTEKKWVDSDRSTNPVTVSYWASFYCIGANRLITAQVEGPVWGS